MDEDDYLRIHAAFTASVGLQPYPLYTTLLNLYAEISDHEAKMQSVSEFA